MIPDRVTETSVPSFCPQGAQPSLFVSKATAGSKATQPAKLADAAKLPLAAKLPSQQSWLTQQSYRFDHH